MWQIIVCVSIIYQGEVVSKKVKFLYSTVSSLQDCSKRFTLYFLERYFAPGGLGCENVYHLNTIYHILIFFSR